jgi:hypothetical protein
VRTATHSAMIRTECSGINDNYVSGEPACSEITIRTKNVNRSLGFPELFKVDSGCNLRIPVFCASLNIHGDLSSAASRTKWNGASTVVRTRINKGSPLRQRGASQFL